jgi:hypothetical protein
MPDASRAIRVLCVLLLTLFLTIALAAATGPQPDLVRRTVDGGGGTSREGPFVLHGTIGQPEAGARASSPPYTLTGGFWSLTPRREQAVYLPLVVRAYP